MALGIFLNTENLIPIEKLNTSAIQSIHYLESKEATAQYQQTHSKNSSEFKLPEDQKSRLKKKESNKETRL